MIEVRLRQNPKLKQIHDRVSVIPSIDAGHAFDHTLRVASLCAKLFANEMLRKQNRTATEMELDSAMVAGLLHDCVPVAKDSPLRAQSADLCASQASDWLQELEWDGFLTEIVEAIQDHSYSSGRVPRSLIGEVLQDADRLEALGAIGLYRTIATGVSMGAKLFDPQDPWAERRPLDDKRYTLDHFYVKLLKLPETFRTAAAREEALKRAKFLEQFAAQLKAELQP